MNVIQDLGGAPAAAPTPSESGGIPSLDSNLPAIPEGPLKVLRGVANGQIPGVVIPEGTPEIASELKPEDLPALGVGFYRPASKGLLGVLFNPDQVSESMLKKLDKEDKLSSTLPSISSLLGDSATGGGSGEDQSPTDETAASGSPAADAVPILPRTSFGSDAQGALANDRLQNLATEPSKRKLPGAGSVLNGLVNRAV